jgi:hypothetical protein
MALLGRGVLAIWSDIASGGDEEFNEWHTREHVPERVRIPGFLRGRRYVAVTGGPKYFMLYETDTVETLQGPAYLARLNDPTPWTQKALALFRNTNRTACRVRSSLGQGIGGSLATMQLAPREGREEEGRAWLTGKTLPELVKQPGIVGVHFCEADVAVTLVPTEERKLRAGEDAVARWVVLVEALDDDALRRASTGELLTPSVLDARGGVRAGPAATYRLQYGLVSLTPTVLSTGRQPVSPSGAN